MGKGWEEEDGETDESCDERGMGNRTRWFVLSIY